MTALNTLSSLDLFKVMQCALEEIETRIKPDINKPDINKLPITTLEMEGELGRVKAELGTVKAELETCKAELGRVKAELETYKTVKQVQYATDSAYGKLKAIGDELFATQNETNVWRNTLLESINELKPDPAGKVGEEFTKAICLACNIKNESTGDTNSKDGTYDQKIKGMKVEIKTARLGGNKYQHETLKKEGCDYWLFVDCHPNGGCITILPRFDLTKKHPITGTTPSLRKGTTDVYKWDFTENHHNKFVVNGAAIRFDKETKISELGDFIRSKIM